MTPELKAQVEDHEQRIQAIEEFLAAPSPADPLEEGHRQLLARVREARAQKGS